MKAESILQLADQAQVVLSLEGSKVPVGWDQIATCSHAGQVTPSRLVIVRLALGAN